MTTKPNFGTLIEILHIQASKNPCVNNIIHEVLKNKNFTMACPNLLKDLKRDFYIQRYFFIALKLTFVI
jgi:hypothetical protein